MQKIVNLVDLERMNAENAPTLNIVAVDTDENEPPKSLGQKNSSLFNPLLKRKYFSQPNPENKRLRRCKILQEL